MKKILIAVFITATCLLAAGHVDAQAQGKIGYISTDELISIMPETVKADSNLQQYRTALIQSAQDRQTSLESAIEKFNKDSSTMTSAVKDVKRADLQKMLTDIQGEEQRIQQQLQGRQQELIQPIQKKAFDAIQAVAKESGYSWVFEKQALIVAPPAEDVLPLVAKKLNLKIPTQGGAGGQRPGPQRPSATGPSK